MKNCVFVSCKRPNNQFIGQNTMKSLNNPSILEHSGSAPIFINSGHNFVNCDDFKTGLLFQYSLNLLYFYSIFLLMNEKKICTYFFTWLKCSSETKMYSVLALTRFKAAFKVLVLSILLVLSVLYLLCLFLIPSTALEFLWVFVGM